MVEQDKKPSFAEVCDQMDGAWKAMVKAGQVDSYRALPEGRADELANGRKPKSGEENIAAYLRAVKAYTSGNFSLNGEESAEDR